jgi:IS1 family transposase
MGRRIIGVRRAHASVAATAEERRISEERRTRVEYLLRERLSLRGICRAVGVSLSWLLPFRVECFAACPDEEQIRVPQRPPDVGLRRLAAEAEAMWSCVTTKANTQWSGLAMDAITRQVMAFQVGDRSRARATALWTQMPLVYREQAPYHPEQYDADSGVLPAERHTASTKKARKTTHIERCNITLRPCVSRLVRDPLPFSKQLVNHIGAIKYCMCSYHLTRVTAAALPG